MGLFFNKSTIKSLLYLFVKRLQKYRIQNISPILLYHKFKLDLSKIIAIELIEVTTIALLRRKLLYLKYTIISKYWLNITL